MLLNSASLLQNNFSSARYKPDTVTMNTPLSQGGMPVFRGQDVVGHATVLVLQTVAETAKDGPVTQQPIALDLFYIANPDNPDVFCLAPGQF